MKTMKTAIVIGMLGCALAVIGLGCKDDSSQSGGQDNDTYLKVQLVGTWDREFDVAPVIYEKIFKDDGTVLLKEFRKSDDVTPARGAESRYHRRFKSLPLYEQTAGTWDIHDGQIFYKLRLPNGTEMPQRYKIERITANEFVQSSDGVDARIEESYSRGRTGQSPRPAATTAPVSHRT